MYAEPLLLVDLGGMFTLILNAVGSGEMHLNNIFGIESGLRLGSHT
jgi:hypothetical protein